MVACVCCVCARKMGVTDPARVNALFNVFDIDGDGEVSFTECVTRLALFQRVRGVAVAVPCRAVRVM